jgi:hypothetical protein
MPRSIISQFLAALFCSIVTLSFSYVDANPVLTAQLASDRATYVSGQPIVLTVVLQNIGVATKTVIVSHAAHLDVQLTVTSQGAKVLPNLPFIPESGAARDVGLAPGEKFTESDNLSKWRYTLGPGDYIVSGDFVDEVDGVTLKTNALHIAVTP